MSEVQTSGNNNGKTLAIISMVCGILSIVSSYGGIAFGIAGLILNSKAKAAGNDSTFVKVGKITSIIGIILAVIWIIVAIALAAAGTAMGVTSN